MTKTVRIYGVDVEFTDKAPTEDGLYWALDGIVHFQTVVDGGYSDTGCMPSESGWLWSAPLVPSDKIYNILEEIVSTPFYQRTCRGGDMERLMNQAIEALGGGK